MSHYLSLCFFIILTLFGRSCAFAQETLTITTYYPSPYGVYNELQFYPHSSPTTTCDNAHKGTTYYNSIDDQIYVCKGTTDGWQPMVSGIPSGVIVSYGGSTAPSGWLLCNGSAVSRTTYAGLFAVIGTAYGAGDGFTTFNVPDFRSRTIVGAGQGTDLTLRSRGDEGGEEMHTLTLAEIPSHTHTFERSVGAGSGTAFQDGQSPSVWQSTTAAGGGGAHNNMPPFGVANYIIKY